MGSNQLTISNVAKKDIDEALSYISLKLLNPKATNDLYIKLLEVFDQIKRFPESYALTDYYLVSFTNIRKAPVNNYLLFYRYFKATKEIVIIRFLNSKRNFDDLFASIEW